MAERSGLITLQSFLKKYFFKAGMDEDEMHRYSVIAADGLKELNIHHVPISKTVVLTIDSTNLTSDFPADYIDYVFLAVERDGRYWLFTRDDSMVDKTIAGLTGTNLGDKVYVVGPGAVGGHNDYWFRPDFQNRRFLFSGVTTTDTVVLNYQSSGIESTTYVSTTDIQFPIYVEEALERYLRWQIAEWSDAPDNMCQRRERQYTDAVRMLRNLNSLSVSEIRDIWAGSSNVTGVIRS